MITEIILEELKEAEDGVDAYDNCYYDTHDLDYIEKNYENYKELLESFEKFRLENNTWGNHYLENNILKLYKWN